MGRKKRRIDHHQPVLDGIREFLQVAYPEQVVVQMHTKRVRYMPKELKGVPDLIISTSDHTTYCEIKPRYLKSRRDTLKKEQAEFALEIYPKVSKHLRYWIVDGVGEFMALWNSNSQFYADDYHQNTIAKYGDMPW